MFSLNHLKNTYKEANILYELKNMYDDEKEIKSFIFRMYPYNTIPENMRLLLVNNYKYTVDAYKIIIECIISDKISRVKQLKKILQEDTKSLNKYFDGVIKWLEQNNFFDKIAFLHYQNTILHRLNTKRLETGIHYYTQNNNIYIMAQTIIYALTKNKAPQIIVITEHKNILDTMIAEYKQELKQCSIINCISERTEYWHSRYINNVKPTLIFINRIHLNNVKTAHNVDLVIHDECHKIKYCSEFLQSCIENNRIVVGLSSCMIAKQSDIYMRNQEPNILTTYNMFDWIETKMLLEPTFHWYNIQNKYFSASQNICAIINEISIKTNKKIYVWCGTQENANKWYIEFNNHNDHKLQIGVDNRQNKNDYKLFKETQKNSIIFSSNRTHIKEVSNIDMFVFLDDVHNTIYSKPEVFMNIVDKTIQPQHNKKTGHIVSFVQNKNYDRQITKSIISYYNTLTNNHIVIEKYPQRQQMMLNYYTIKWQDIMELIN